MSSNRSTKEINDMMLANFMAASLGAGKHMLAAPLYKPVAKEVEQTKSIDEQLKTIDEQFAVLRACFGIVDPLLQTSVLQQPSSSLNPNSPAWIPPISVKQEQEPEPESESEPENLALLMRWTKTKDANGKIKRVFTLKK
jgi:hypothetical protein